MLKSYFKGCSRIPHGTPALVRRLLVEQAAGQWRRYALAFSLMGIAALATALGAYLIGDVINAGLCPQEPPGHLLARAGDRR